MSSRGSGQRHESGPLAAAEAEIEAEADAVAAPSVDSLAEQPSTRTSTTSSLSTAQHPSHPLNTPVVLLAGQTPFWRRLLPYFLQHWPALLLAMTCIGLVSASLGLQVYLLRTVLDRMLQSGAGSERLWLPAALMGAFVLQAVGEVGRGYLLRKVGSQISTRLRLQLFQKIQEWSWVTLSRFPSGELSAALQTETEGVQRLVTVLITITQKPLSLMVLLAVALRQEPGLTLLSLLGIPLAILPVSWLRQRVKRWAQSSLKEAGQVQAILQDGIQGGRMIRAYGLEGWISERFASALQRQAELTLKSTFATLVSGPLVQLSAALGGVFLIWHAGESISRGESTPGSFVAYILAVVLMYDPLKSLAQVPILWSQARVGLEGLFARLDTESGLADGSVSFEPQPPVVLELKDVSFCYDGREVLRNIQFRAETGQWIGIVGRSGAGKSTLLSLILRLMDPSSGQICVQGRPLTEYRLQSIRRHMGWVPQDVFLIDDNTSANVRLGRLSAEEAAVEEALRRSELSDWGGNGSEAAQKPVGELGSRISGGQRQRLGLARALVRKPALLLLDEATSALDARTEEAIRQTLLTLKSETLLLVVAHRLSMVRQADLILVMEEGRIVEQGTHEALMTLNGTYAQMYISQQR